MNSVEIYRTVSRISGYQSLTKKSLADKLHSNVKNLIDLSEIDLQNPKQSKTEAYKLLLNLLHVKVVTTVYLLKSVPKYVVDMNRREHIVYAVTLTNGIDTIEVEVMDDHLMSLPKENDTIDVQFTYNLREPFLEMLLQDTASMTTWLRKVQNDHISIDTMYEPYSPQVTVMPTVDEDWRWLMNEMDKEERG